MKFDFPPAPAPHEEAPPSGPSRWERFQETVRELLGRLQELIRRLRIKERLHKLLSRKEARWGVPLVIAVMLGLLFGIVVAAVIQMPRVDTLATFTPARITQVYDVNGDPFASFMRQRRVVLKEDEIPDVLRNAIIAAEDRRFYQHGGIDALGVLRAEVENLRQGRIVQGASTITMQLARQLFLSPERTWHRKIEEALLAVELEKNYSKQQILTLYCNVVFLGHGNYGMEAAARHYFGKSVGELEPHEAATLAGIVKAPSRLSPYENPAAVRQRRDVVLHQMRDLGFLNPEEHDTAIARPVLPVTHRPKEEIGPYFAEEVRKTIESTYGTSALLEHGLQVDTTLDPEIQEAAVNALRFGLLGIDHPQGWRGARAHLDSDNLEEEELPSWDRGEPIPGQWYEGVVLEVSPRSALVKIHDQTYPLEADGLAWTEASRADRLLRPGDVAWFRLDAPEGEEGLRLYLEQEPELEGAVIVLESATGAIRAMVGGWDFQRSRFNRATQARRQLGSAFKPFVYGAGLEQGFTPADTLFDAPVFFAGEDKQLTYSPRNYYRNYYGLITLRRALEISANVTAVKLLDLVGVRRVIDFARRCGLTSPLPPWPSLALGAADLSPLEVATAYSTIANQGTRIEPFMIRRITTPEGRVLDETLPKGRAEVDPSVAYVLSHLLEGVIDRGTGWRLADLPLDLAGKTGTTDDYTDAWFVGFTPRYTILSWVGYDLKRTIGRDMTGAKAALPVWRHLVQAGLEAGWLKEGETFPSPPSGVVLHKVEYWTGLLPDRGAERLVEEAFLRGTEPVRRYSPEWSLIMELPWYQQRPFYTPKEGEKMPESFEHLADLLAELDEQEAEEAAAKEP